MDRQHQSEYDAKREDRVGAVHHSWTDEHPHCTDIVRGVRHDIARRRVLIVSKRERLDVFQEVVSQIVFDMPRNIDDRPAGEVKKDAAECRDEQQHPCVFEELILREIRLQTIDGIPYKHGSDDLKPGRYQNRRNAEDQRFTVAFEIWF